MEGSWFDKLTTSGLGAHARIGKTAFLLADGAARPSSFPRKRESTGPGMQKSPTVYILASKRNRTHYIGVTSDLVKRVWEHRHDLVDGFSKKYSVHRLVYFEQHGDMASAISREKQLKKWNRAWKIALIQKGNPEWRDLWENML